MNTRWFRCMLGLVGSLAAFSHVHSQQEIRSRYGEQSFLNSDSDFLGQKIVLASDLMDRMVIDEELTRKVDNGATLETLSQRNVFRETSSAKLFPIEVIREEITRGGTFLQIDFETTGPAKPYILLSQDPLFASQEDDHWVLNDIGDTYEAGEMGHIHSIAFKDLEPDTTYFLVILLNLPPETDFVGYKAMNLNETTMKRRVDVNWNLLNVIDDSDDLSCGDLFFIAQLGHPNANFYDAGNTWDTYDFAMDIHSGSLKPLEIWLTAIDVPSQIKVAVSCADDDTDLIGDWYGIGEYWGYSDQYLGTGINADEEWNSGFWTFNIEGVTEMSEGDTLSERERFQFTRKRTVHESDCSDLEYAVTFEIYVSYE